MTVTRRLFAGGIATAASVPLFSRSTPAREVATVSPELAALAAKLPAAERDYHAAVDAARAAYREWMPELPLAPDYCTHGPNTRFHYPGEDMERDIFGVGFIRKGEEVPRRIRSAEWMRETAARYREALAKDDKRKRSYGKRARDGWIADAEAAERGLELLPAYLAERDAILKASRGRELAEERYEAAEALVALVAKIARHPTNSAAAAKIKADAAVALGRMPRQDALMMIAVAAPELVSGFAEALAYATGAA